jgi:hypothetical protein
MITASSSTADVRLRADAVTAFSPRRHTGQRSRQPRYTTIRDATETQQCPHHHKGDQFGVGQPRLEPHLWSPRPVLRMVGEKIVGRHLQCGCAGVQSASISASGARSG